MFPHLVWSLHRVGPHPEWCPRKSYQKEEASGTRGPECVYIRLRFVPTFNLRGDKRQWRLCVESIAECPDPDLERVPLKCKGSLRNDRMGFIQS